MTKSLDQTRATHALNAVTDDTKTFIGKNQNDVVKKLPQLIMTNGLLGVLAFTKKESDASGYGKAMLAVGSHLAQKEVALLNAAPATVRDFIDMLARADARALRHATAETLAYLNYLKRFAS